MTGGLKKLYHRVRFSLLFKSILHTMAMNAPLGSLRWAFYRMRGVRVGRGVAFGPGVFIEETRPELVIIEDNVSIAPNVTIISHDSSYSSIDPRNPVRRENVVIKRNAFIGAGSTILPGVTIGEFSIVGAGSVVVDDIPPWSVAVGVPARVIKIIDVKYKK